MADEEGVRLPITALLLRPGYGPSSCLTPTFGGIATFHKWQDNKIEAIDAADLTGPPTSGSEVVLVLFKKVVAPPRWQQFIEDAFGISGFTDSKRGSRGAIAFCPVHDPADPEGPMRWVAWSFGSATQGLQRGTVDPRFGLLTALNRMSDASPHEGPHPGRIRQFQYRQFGAFRQRTSHQAARDTPVEGFRFDRQMDLLSGVGGPRSDDKGHVYGGRPLRQRESVSSPQDLVALAQAALEDYRSDHYSTDYPFIDDYLHVDDPVLVTRLRVELFADIDSESDDVDVFLPDDLVELGDDRAVEFILFPGEQASSASRINLTIDGLRKKLEGADESALDWTLRFCDANRDVVGDATILDCLAAEVVVDGDRFLLSDGSFFKVDADFISRLHSEIEGIVVTDLDLPCFRGKREDEWNASVAEAKPHEFVCLDGNLIHLPGETPFEPADLIHVSGRLIYAKKKGRSSALSYVFVQARKSCQLLSQVPRACDDLRSKTDAAASDASKVAFGDALSALDDRPPSIEVVLAFLGDWRGKDLKNLPLLAKLELVDAVRSIELYGFRPTVAMVDLCRDPAELVSG